MRSCSYLKGGPQRVLTIDEIEANWWNIIRGGDNSDVFKKMWLSLDADGGGTCSLSELECWIVQVNERGLGFQFERGLGF